MLLFTIDLFKGKIKTNCNTFARQAIGLKGFDGYFAFWGYTQTDSNSAQIY